MTTCTLLLSPPVHAVHAQALRAAAAPAALQFAIVDPDHPPTPAQIAAVDIALVSLDVLGHSTKLQLTPYMQFFSAQLRAATNLRWMHVPTAGVDRPIFLEMLARGVRVTNSSGANAEAVAHTALMGVMVLGRGGLHWARGQRDHRWAALRGDDALPDLAGQTALVVGHGPVGRGIVRLLEALGMQVQALRHQPEPGDAGRGIHGYDALPALARSTQWLVLACPLSEATRNLVDGHVLHALPRGAHLVNVSRGGVLDEQALLDALASGHIAGAHMDVFAQEPLPMDSPFWDLPNMIVTPHNAGATRQYGERCVQMFVANLRRWVRGGLLQQEVTPQDRR